MGCRQNNTFYSDDPPPLFPQPLRFSLDTIKGYSINPLNGDSIQTLLDPLGNQVKTGFSFYLEELPDNISKATSISYPARPAHFPIPKKIINSTIAPQSKLIDPRQLITIDLIQRPPAVKTQVIGKKSSAPLPGFSMALPLRYKDASTSDIKYIDVDQGLQFPYISSVLESSNGELWISLAENGVSRYNGITFHNYTIKNGLTSNTVLFIFEDSKKRIWFGTEKGVSLFDGKNIIQFTRAQGFTDFLVSGITEDKMGTIWFTTIGDGLFSYDGNSMIHFTSKQGLPSDKLMNCLVDKNGVLWITSNEGLVSFSEDRFTLYSSEQGAPTSGHLKMLLDKKGNIWITSKGLVEFDGKKFISYLDEKAFHASSIVVMKEDKEGNLWIGSTYDGVLRFDGKTFTKFGIDEGLTNCKISCIDIGKTGLIWVGTDGGGLNMVNPVGFFHLGTFNLAATEKVRPIISARNGNTWFGTGQEGVVRLGKDISYFNEKNQVKFLGQRSLLEDKNGNIWFGSNDLGAIKYDGRELTSYGPRNQFISKSIFSMLEDKKNNIWFGSGTPAGLTSYSNNRLIHYDNKNGLPGESVLSLFQDREQAIWIGTAKGGLTRLKNSQLINYSEKQGLFTKDITSIISDKKGNLWLGTIGAGVCSFNGNQFIYYTTREGLSNNNVWSLIQDPNGIIWAGTDNGLNELVQVKNKDTMNEEQRIIFKYGLQEGLKALDFSLNGAAITASSMIYWGTGKGIVSRGLPSSHQSINLKPPVLDGIEINDSAIDIFSKNVSKHLSLSYDQNHLIFYFAAIDWSAPSSIKYSFRLSGLDTKWSVPSEEPKAEFRNLSYGNYQLQVRAISASQTWSLPLIYSFRIEPAWWQTWWFKIVVSLIALLTAFYLSKQIYLAKLRRQGMAMEKQLAVQYERQRISSEMHDDIGAGLSGIKLLTEMTRNKSTDERMTGEVDKIYQSVGDLSAKMKEVIWSLNMENDNLTNLITYLQKQFRVWLEHYPCKQNIDMPIEVPEINVSGETRRNIYLVVKEAIHNIIKHSNASIVEMSIKCDNNKLKIKISDNGNGTRDSSGNETGNGLKNMKRRVAQMNGKFQIDQHKGFNLYFEIPLESQP